MKTTNNILSKIFFFLILAAGGGNSAWAQTVLPSTLHDAHWYTLRLVRANNSYLSSASAYMDNNGLKIRQANQNSANSANESFWCFIPNGDGTYCIYNRAMGPEYRLGTTTNQSNPNTRTAFYRVSDAVPSNVQVKFDVMPSTYNSGGTGFCIKPTGTNKFWDDGKATYLTVWDNSNHSQCLDSDGNCFVTTQVAENVLSSAGYKLVINGATDCTVSVGGRTYQNGENIVLQNPNLKNLTGFTLNNVEAGKFVYGPVIDQTWGTITYTISNLETSFTEGWYQMQVVTGNGVNGKIASRNTNINTQSPYIYAMAMVDEHLDTGNDYWGMKYSGVPTYAGEAATYVHLTPIDAGNTQILLPTGHYMQNNGCTSRTAVNVTTRWQNAYLATRQWIESNATGWDEAPAAAASDGYPRNMALRKIDISQYSVYKVEIDDWAAATNTYLDPTVTIVPTSPAAEKNCGLSKVYQNGYFFFERGYEPTIDDFTVSSMPSNVIMEIEGTSAVRILHFKHDTPATEGWKAIITKPDGDPNEYRVTTTAAIKSGRHYALHGEYLDLVDDPTPVSVTLNTDHDFVWGPFIDTEARTITFEVRSTTNAFQAGRWYQLQLRNKAGQWFDQQASPNVQTGNMVDGINNIRAHAVRHKGSQIYAMSSRIAGQYPLELTGVDPDGDASYSYVYVPTVNNSNITILSQNGSYVYSDGSGRASATTVPLNYSSATNSFLWNAKTGPWAHANTSPYITVGMTGSFSGPNNIELIAHPVKTGEDFNIYRVNVGAGIHVKYIGAKHVMVVEGGHFDREQKTATAGQYFFFPKDYVPVARDFTVENSTPTTFTITPGDVVNDLEIHLALKDGVSFRFVDTNGNGIDASVFYIDENGQEHELNRQGTFDFHNRDYNPDYFKAKGSMIIRDMIYNTSSNVITFTLKYSPNVLRFSPAPSQGNWDADTHWFTWRNNRSGQGASVDLRYMTTAAGGVDTNYYFVAKEGCNPMYVNDAGGAWCFVGDNTTGFEIYNKAYGPEFVFAYLGSNNFAMVNKNEKPSDARTTFTYGDNSTIIPEGTEVAYIFKIGTNNPNNHIHVTNGNLTDWNAGDGNRRGDTGSSFTVTHIEDEIIDNLPEYDVYKVIGADVVYSGTSTKFGRRTGKPYLFVDKDSPMTINEAYGPYASLVTGFAVATLSGSNYIKTITARKADTSKDYYRVILQGCIPENFHHVVGDGQWRRAASGGSSAKRVPNAGDDRESYFVVDAGASFNGGNIHPQDASNVNIDYRSLPVLAEDDGLFKRTFAIVFPGIIVHRPNVLLQKAISENYTTDTGFNIDKNTNPYIDVKLKDGSTVKLQNTSVFEITHFLKPGEVRDIWMSPTSSSSDKESKLKEYMCWYDYDTERLPDFNVFNFKASASNSNSLENTAKKFVNGYVMGSNSAHGGGYTQRFVRVTMPAHTKASKDAKGKYSGYAYNLAGDLSRWSDHHYNWAEGDAGALAASFTDPNGRASGNDNFLEPTIGLRQIFHVRSAYEMADQLSTCTGDNWLEKETITFPSRGNNWRDWYNDRTLSIAADYNYGDNFYNALPLNYVYKNYWTYDGAGNLIRVGDVVNGQRVIIESVVVDDEQTGITIKTTNAYGYLDGSIGTYAEKNSEQCRDASRFIQFAYPVGGIIPNMQDVARRKATINVYLKVGSTRYNLKQFTLYFQNDTEPLPYYEILEHPELTRSDEYLRNYTGKVHARMHFDTKYIRAYDPNDGTTHGNSTMYYQYPLDFSQTAYGYYHPDAEYVEWSEYGVRIHGGTATSWKNSHGNGGSNPLYEGTTYLRALYDYKALQNQSAGSNARLQQTRDAYENSGSDDTHIERKARAYAEAQRRAAASAEELAAARANLQTAYDRSYCIYADVSEQPGQIARIIVPDQLCMGTQIFCTAWVGTATAVNQGSPYPASAIFRFRGVKINSEGKEELTTIYSYCPGQISNIAVNSQRQLVAGRQETKPDGTSYYQAIWQQVYFTCTNNYPNGTFDHFVLEIDNNSKGSSGSDLYFDDVRIYTQKPVVKVENAAPVCSHEMNVVRIATDYESFITALEGAVPDESDPQRNYVGVYSFLDSKIYKETLEATDGDFEAAFRASLIGDTNYDNCVIDGQFFPELYAYHNIKFHNHYNDHDPILYHQLATNERLEMAHRMDYIDENGNITNRKLVFNCSLADERLKSTEYLIVFQAKELTAGKTPKDIIDSEVVGKAASFYDLSGNCAIIDTLHAVLATRAEIDFDNDLDPSALNFCEGTNPSISLTGYSYDYNGKIQAVTDQYYDWYYGTLEEFDKEAVYVGDAQDDRDGEKWHPEQLVGLEDFCMYHLLLNFRHFYPDAGEVQVNNGTVTAKPWEKDPVTNEEFEFTPHMLSTLKKWIEPDERTGLQKLYLHKISVVLPSSPDLQTVLAVQLGETYRYEDGDTEKERPIIYCMEPVEIKYRTSLKSPVSHIGMADVDYSETPFNNHDELNTYSLPVRLTASMVEAMTKGKELRIPLRNIRPSGFFRKPDASNADVRFIRNDQHYDIVVEQSNDPQWQKFVTAEEGPVQPIVGQILSIEAQASRLKSLRDMFRGWLGIKKPVEDDYSEYVRINFKPDLPAGADADHPLYRKFEPREGYYYILSVPYLEQLVEGELLDPNHKITDEYGNVLSKPCEGNLLLPLKIVPEYAVWTGTVNNDWNNDRNWQRADYRELVPSESQNHNDPFAAYRSNTSDGDGGSSVEEGDYNGIPVLNVAAGTPLEERDIYVPTEIYESASNDHTYSPMSSTSIIVPAEGITNFPVLVAHDETDEGLLNIVDGKDDAATPATPWIRYDMVATDHDGKQDYYSVVKYYENHVKDITFLPETRMYGTEHLNYKKAWVEYELAADRWYTLASPLQNTYSGDWYSPTASDEEAGRQLTPHFNGIYYSESLNDRFNPAYYQRSWDKGLTKAYQCLSNEHGDGFYANSNPYNTAVWLDWSKVYNDVEVNYSNGGFSVKPYFPEGAAGNVIVRMPKEDETYNYYDPGNVHGGHNTNMDRHAGHHRLFTEKLKNADHFTQSVQNVNGSPYYLVANPFMAPMDMDEFFDVNDQFEAGKFWILAADKQEVNIKYLATGDWLSTSVAANGTVAPLQAFFVKRKSPTTGQITVKYTADMEAALSKGSAPLKAPRQRSTATAGTFMISNGESVALCSFTDGASNAFDSAEDAELLLDSNLSDHVATVFTTALNAAGEAQAMQANVLSTTVTTLPIGVIAPTDPAAGVGDDYETTLTFTGTDALAAAMAVDVKGESAEPYLYDALLGTHTPISEGMTLTVTGNSSGRYFIVSGMHMPYDNADDNDNGEALDSYNLHGIRVATPQRGTVTIRGSRKEFNR